MLTKWFWVWLWVCVIYLTAAIPALKGLWILHNQLPQYPHQDTLSTANFVETLVAVTMSLIPTLIIVAMSLIMMGFVLCAEKLAKSIRPPL